VIFRRNDVISTACVFITAGPSTKLFTPPDAGLKKKEIVPGSLQRFPLSLFRPVPTGSRGAAALRGAVQQLQAGDILGPRVPGACVGTRVNAQTVRRQLLRTRIAPA
jgi:hypothetical protein